MEARYWAGGWGEGGVQSIYAFSRHVTFPEYQYVHQPGNSSSLFKSFYNPVSGSAPLP